jgi:hypothetical protein
LSTWFLPPTTEAELNFSGRVTFSGLVGDRPSLTRALDGAALGSATRVGDPPGGRTLVASVKVVYGAERVILA